MQDSDFKVSQGKSASHAAAGKLALLGVLNVSLFLFHGCVNVDEEVAARPSELWRPPAEAQANAPKPDNPGIDAVNFVAGQDKYYTQGLAGYEKNPVASVGLPKLDLPALVDIALSNNPETRYTWLIARTRASEYGQSLSEYYPYVSVGASVAREKQKNVAVPGKTYSTAYGPSLNINWLLFNFGEREATANAARQALFASNFTYNQIYQDVVREVLIRYYDLWSAESNLEASKAFLLNTEATFDAADKKLKSGLGNKQDALRALANVKTAEAQIEGDIAAIEAARAKLATALGIEVSASLQIEQIEEFPEFDTLDADVNRLVAEALQNRPNLLSSYASVREQEFNLDAARADLFPELSAQVSMQYLELTGSNPSPYNDYVAALVLEWDIFQGFYKWYEIDKQRDRARAARQDARQVELEVLQQVWTAFFAYRSAIKQVDSTTSALDAQQQAYDAISIGYESGINNLLDLLTSQEDLDDARRNLISAKNSLGTSIADLARATGNLPRLTREQ
ncbi:TolC family protein [Cerasicoccus fimbriatus]|uniref:TolC family protein n=1 Tax=Cerasicoccus fimbriatus TaxID=3014554 RepID=UPI0022B50B3A|nr:TolC family protein [Cerasicoccus sp. TK19100]